MTDNMPTPCKVLIMAGGTGGHVFPAMATAVELLSRGCSVEWLGTAKGIENRIVPENNIPLHYLTISGVRGKGIVSLVTAPWKILRAVYEARKIIRAISPTVILGMGGYVSGPGGLAAKLMGLPLVIHEQNARPGTTNKWLSKVANRVLTAFPGVFQRGECIGNPVRREIADIENPETRLNPRSDTLRLLILGGSLGARAINRLIPEVLLELKEQITVDVIHQSGETHFSDTKAEYAQRGIEADVRPFIDNMAEALGWADLVICRSGALTVSELSIAGCASILIPFPYAIDDHQTANANWLAGLGAAIVKQQSNLSVNELKTILMDLSLNRSKLQQMACAARRAARSNAAAVCADTCMEVSRG